MKNGLLVILLVILMMSGLAAYGAPGAKRKPCEGEVSGATVQTKTWELPDSFESDWIWDCSSVAENGDYKDQIDNYKEPGATELFTKPDTNQNAVSDRIKIQLRQQFGRDKTMPIVGTWEWKTRLPKIAPDDDFSTGMFLYADDQHEVDIECGWGTGKSSLSGASWRSRSGATGEELVCGMTVQPWETDLFQKVTADTFHTFTMEITKTHAIFTIDGSYVGAIHLCDDPNKYSWRSIISAENLWWMGARGQRKPNYAYTTQQYRPAFDYVKFTSSAPTN